MNTTQASKPSSATTRPVVTPLAMTFVSVAITLAFAGAFAAFAPGIDSMVARLVTTAALVVLGVLAATKAGLRSIGAGGPRTWTSVWILAVPVVLTFVPLLWGWNPPALSSMLVLCFGYLFTGIYEELWFRGVMLKKALPMGPVRASALTAVLFGVTHLCNIAFGQNAAITAAQAVGAAAFGFGYSVMRLRTRALWVLVFTHAVSDLLFHVTGLHGGLMILVIVAHDVIIFVWGAILCRGLRSKTVKLADQPQAESTAVASETSTS